MSRTYHQTGSYIPETDWGICQWLRNFSARIHENAARFGLTASDATVLVNIYKSYCEAFELTQDSSTRTPAAIAAKDAQRAAALATVRTYAGLIRSNLAVDNQGLIDLGMNPRNHSRSPIGAPRTAPVIAVQAAFSCQHQMIYHDETTPTSRRKPFGVVQMLLLWRVLERGEQITPTVLDPRNFHHNMTVTKTPFLVTHASENAGKSVVYYARWVTRTGLSGPWSAPVYFTIANGGPALDVINENERATKMKRSDRGDGESSLKMAA